uniref:Uncharacterized protein n=1 Tax=Zonotrichia albicollis TaxID=44394 RepID=A0A8D2M4I1_ZONAL
PAASGSPQVTLVSPCVAQSWNSHWEGLSPGIPGWKGLSPGIPDWKGAQSWNSRLGRAQSWNSGLGRAQPISRGPRCPQSPFPTEFPGEIL